MITDFFETLRHFIGYGGIVILTVLTVETVHYVAWSLKARRDK